MAAQPSAAAVGDPPDFPLFGSFHPHHPRAVPLTIQRETGSNPNLATGVSSKKTMTPPSVSVHPRMSGPQTHQRSYADVVNLRATIPKPDLHLFDKASTPAGVKSFLRDGARVVLFDAAVTSSLAEPFKWSLVGKFSHGVPAFTKIGNFFSSLELVGKFKLHRLNHRQFLVNFGDETDFVRVWLGRLWHVAGFPMRMLKWSPSFDTKVESSTVPVWVRLPGMPVHLFNRDVLFEVASNLGKPIRADSDTACRFKLSEARFCVEVDLLLPRIEHLLLEIDGKVRTQRVVYENLPEFCSFCSCIGHGVTACFKANKQLTLAVSPNVFHASKVVVSSDLEALAVVAKPSQKSQMVGGLVFMDHNGLLQPFLKLLDFGVSRFMGSQFLNFRFISSSVASWFLVEGDFVVEEGVESGALVSGSAVSNGGECDGFLVSVGGVADDGLLDTRVDFQLGGAVNNLQIMLEDVIPAVHAEGDVTSHAVVDFVVTASPLLVEFSVDLQSGAVGGRLHSDVLDVSREVMIEEGERVEDGFQAVCNSVAEDGIVVHACMDELNGTVGTVHSQLEVSRELVENLTGEGLLNSVLNPKGASSAVVAETVSNLASHAPVHALNYVVADEVGDQEYAAVSGDAADFSNSMVSELILPLHATVHSHNSPAVVVSGEEDPLAAFCASEVVVAEEVGLDPMDEADGSGFCLGPSCHSNGPEVVTMTGPARVSNGPSAFPKEHGPAPIDKINEAAKTSNPFRLFKDKRQMDKMDGILKSGFLRKPVRNVQGNKPCGESKATKTPLQLAQEELSKGGAFHDFVITDSHTSKPFSNMDFMARMSWADEMEDDVD